MLANDYQTKTGQQWMVTKVPNLHPGLPHCDLQSLGDLEKGSYVAHRERESWACSRKVILEKMIHLLESK
jgi:hypothetical protein